MNFAETTILPADVKKASLKATLMYIKNLFKNKNFLMDYPDNQYLVTQCMHSCIQGKKKYDGSIDR